jgi:hypothetical protein
MNRHRERGGISNSLAGISDSWSVSQLDGESAHVKSTYTFTNRTGT